MVLGGKLEMLLGLLQQLAGGRALGLPTRRSDWVWPRYRGTSERPARGV